MLTSIENLPGFEARAAFYRQLRVSVPLRREYCVYRRGRYLLLYPWGGDNQPLAHRPFGR